jgi:hypothetical protein
MREGLGVEKERHQNEKQYLKPVAHFAFRMIRERFLRFWYDSQSNNGKFCLINEISFGR